MNGQYIKEMRAALGWSANRLSKKIGVHYNTIYNWEKHPQQELTDNQAKLVELALKGGES
jgi:DNA-binding XRE family transcriptional regulator